MDFARDHIASEQQDKSFVVECWAYNLQQVNRLLCESQDSLSRDLRVELVHASNLTRLHNFPIVPIRRHQRGNSEGCPTFLVLFEHPLWRATIYRLIVQTDDDSSHRRVIQPVLLRGFQLRLQSLHLVLQM